MQYNESINYEKTRRAERIYREMVKREKREKRQAAEAVPRRYKRKVAFLTYTVEWV
jgi:hypothetical protein